MPSTSERNAMIDKIGKLPGQIEQLVSGLTDEQLTTHFLDGEWTVAQNVHHLVDSHIMSLVRCRMMLTQENPTLPVYDQDVFAELPDAKNANLENSIQALKGLHSRWVIFWQNLSDDDWARTGYHPEIGDVSLDRQLQIYSNHGEAHIDQIKRTLAAQTS